MAAASAYLELHPSKTRKACSPDMTAPDKWQLVAGTPPHHAAIASSSPQGRIRCHHCGPSAALERRLQQHQSTGCPEHTQLRRCSRQCMASINHFSRLQACRASAAAASPELPFYLSPVTRPSPMGRRADASLSVSITSPSKLYGAMLPPAGPRNNIRPSCSCLSGFNHVSLAGGRPHAHKGSELLDSG